MRLGIFVFGLATIAAGVINLVWGNFEAAHQPIQSFGEDIPGRGILAHVTAAWLIAAGAAMLWRRTARAGAAAAAAIYLIFAVFWLPRLYTAPQFLGFRFSVIVGVLAGVAQQLILVAAAAIVYARAVGHGSAVHRVEPLARWTFGLAAVTFGLSHLTGVEGTARMVPKWMPLGESFWAVLTGIAFLLAGAAILVRIGDVLAARLLALMLLTFSALVLMPALLPISPHHVVWGSNAYNLAAVAAAWIFAEGRTRRLAERVATGA